MTLSQTNVGTILISINPFKNIGNMYTPAKIASYQNFIGSAEPPPHVYKIAADSLKGVLDFGLNQSIIISGESGAGKTEATKQCLCYMAAVASGSASGMEQKILLSNPILEAFGNAKTIRNDNSSRFGKYIEILLDNGQLCGGRITSFLLEKVRVVQQALNERNFHIFFQLAANPSADFRRKYLIGDVRSYRLLNQSGCLSVPTINDASDMAETLEAMSMLGFSSAEQDSIISLVSSVMHIGNIEFAGTGDRSSDVVPAGAGRVDPLASAAKLMQIAPATLQKALTWNVMRIQGQQNTEISLSAKEAGDTRDVLAKFLFGALFNWIVQKINKAIVPPAGKERSRHIGILDIFGFEIFENNSFEQLCINYTNEKLQRTCHFSYF
jgi:myosin heavy subunit